MSESSVGRVPRPPAEFPYVLHRVGTVMSPLPDEPLEAEGVLNLGRARGRDGELYLLPRLVAAGNVSRVGLAGVIVTDGTPTGVRVSPGCNDRWGPWG